MAQKSQQLKMLEMVTGEALSRLDLDQEMLHIAAYSLNHPRDMERIMRRVVNEMRVLYHEHKLAECRSVLRRS